MRVGPQGRSLLAGEGDKGKCPRDENAKPRRLAQCFGQLLIGLLDMG